MIDADGEIMGTYRKSHIPDGPGYEENTISAPATPVSRCGCFRRASAWASVGTNGIPNARGRWR
jgi:predicted amidohydrolase